MINDGPLKAISIDTIKEKLKELGLDIKIQLKNGGYNTYCNLMNGESKWSLIEDVGPNTTSTSEDCKTLDDAIARIFTDRWNDKCLCPTVALAVLCNLKKIEPDTYLIYCCW